MEKGATIVSELKQRIPYFWVVFAICLVPRILLAIINKEGNDDHVTPILLWLDTGVYPFANDCWECFQPPLFYKSIAVLANAFGVATRDGIFNVIQVSNLVFSSLTLWLCLNLIQSLKLNQLLSVALMLFFGLNPELISIGALNTNDTVVIFLGFVFCRYLVLYWENPSVTKEVILVLLVALVSVMKGNGLVFIAALGFLVLYKHFTEASLRVSVLGRGLVYGVFLLLFVGYFGNYYQRYEMYNNAFLINQEKQPAPHWYEPDEVRADRQGVKSIYHSFGTFPLFSLLQRPYNVNDGLNYPKHRTSLWTQLYGQYSNYLFERHPGKWHSINNDNLNVTRLNYLLHLPLLMLFLWGVFSQLFGSKIHANSENFIHGFLILLFTLFVIRNSYVYRDFSTMKLIFIFPILYAIIHVFAVQAAKIKYTKGLSYLLLACALLYQINFVYLFREII
jgi:hypothetical protein